jgi:hypothetical protein
MADTRPRLYSALTTSAAFSIEAEVIIFGLLKKRGGKFESPRERE